jgi:signal transduction histidine kinase
MKAAEIPENEPERLDALRSYDILDTMPEESFDQIAAIASQICGTPISLVSLVDENRQWFKARVGLHASETPRDVAFCSHAILNPAELFVVSDATKDKRFVDNPLVTGNPDIRFYAGAPLVTEDGFALGTLCVIDNIPRELTEQQRLSLEALASQVIAQMQLRKRIQELEIQELELKTKADEIARFAHLVSHDLKSPLRAISALASVVEEESEGQLNEEGANGLKMLQTKATHAYNLVEGILQHTIAGQKANQPESIDLLNFVESVIEFCAPPEDVHVIADVRIPQATLDPVFLHQILQNLISNAIKYNDKAEGIVHVNIFKNQGHLVLDVTDNGPGIDEKSQAAIFNMLTILASKDRFGRRGTGIGLSTVKRIASMMDAHIELESSPGEGSTFRVKFPNF